MVKKVRGWGRGEDPSLITRLNFATVATIKAGLTNWLSNKAQGQKARGGGPGGRAVPSGKITPALLIFPTRAK